ncbi:hypothetical protein G4B88_001076 [Cannabis sativa]|uniref:Reverse transcriptase zinc-binding domain-containing protein n=1 Tax=Cannabis sativa TaxID=3483 RepID=A0A7J6EDK4_CANSA|nr:hypothetical protein G4B88_001076 [Cannabis sativa]
MDLVLRIEPIDFLKDEGDDKPDSVNNNTKSKINWIKDGDENSASFHASIRERRKQNRILSIEDNQGTRVEDPTQITEAFLSFYYQLLGSQMENRREDRLRTRERMKQFNIIAEDCCLFCKQQPETKSHLFFSYSFSLQWLVQIKLWLDWRVETTNLNAILRWIERSKNSRFKKGFLYVVIASLRTPKDITVIRQTKEEVKRRFTHLSPLPCFAPYFFACTSPVPPFLRLHFHMNTHNRQQLRVSQACLHDLHSSMAPSSDNGYELGFV